MSIEQSFPASALGIVSLRSVTPWGGDLRAIFEFMKKDYLTKTCTNG